VGLPEIGTIKLTPLYICKGCKMIHAEYRLNNFMIHVVIYAKQR